ncbi:MAG: hypothetical protein N2039_02085 [Gemmataceae bacterium]|nr:hypothetical protein [Gemmataceae bacterium]
MLPIRLSRDTLAWVLALLSLFAAQPLSARAADQPTPTVAKVVVAERISWHGFVRYWRNFANRTDRIVLIVGLVAATALFIITRGKWLK